MNNNTEQAILRDEKLIAVALEVFQGMIKKQEAENA